jgi:DNA-binding CsgD family transcriptional regulator
MARTLSSTSDMNKDSKPIHGTSAYLLHFLLEKLACVLSDIDVNILLYDREGCLRYASKGAALYLDSLEEPKVGHQISALVRRCLKEQSAELGAPARSFQGVFEAGGVAMAVGVVPVPDGALAVLSPGRRDVAVPGVADGHGLTQAEQEVACLLALRLSNKEIADKLGIGYHTVKHRVERVLRKLDVTSRTEVATRLAGKSAPRPERLGQRE